MPLAPGQSPHASRALAMPACLSRPGDARMPRALAMSACLSRPGDARMPRALAMSACLSRPGDARMPRALAIPQENCFHRASSYLKRRNLIQGSKTPDSDYCVKLG
ncbi:hypothetical protein VNO80_06706 [Phaseolus coccineus]|uniref:Uncharacterized protein n=1 Tax=Phaseolus coccineus TaxID=3886 RepID=A0AAN9NHB4_PHACN